MAAVLRRLGDDLQVATIEGERVRRVILKLPDATAVAPPGERGRPLSLVQSASVEIVVEDHLPAVRRRRRLWTPFSPCLGHWAHHQRNHKHRDQQYCP